MASKPHSKNFPSVNKKILKPILLTAARKTASIQEHKSYSCALWDDNDFPAEVRTKLENYPRWDLIKAAFNRVYSDKQLEKTFIVDLERLYYHEDSFQWPLKDPHHCLLFGLLREYYKRFMTKLSGDED